MMKKYFVTLCIAISTQVIAQEYAANLIPDSLKENANAVLRKEEVFVQIKGIDKAIVKHKYAITILNQTADKYARFIEQYDKLVSLSDINGNLYDENGVKIKSAKRKDIYDYSDDGGSYLTDNRVKTFSFIHNTYPYTVEFESELEYNGIYYLENWSPIKNDKFSVQQSKFIVETPLDYELRFKQLNFIKEPKKSITKKITYEWELNNLKAIEDVDFMPNLSEISPMVFIAPTQFSISGYTGNMSSWRDYGKFHLQLNNGRNILPDAAKQKVQDIIFNLKTDEEKVMALYNYLQQNTRYISIQLGIGGWQPLAANFVAEKKYGDCKALSNYMVCLLKEAGIKAHYTIIKAKEYGINYGLYEDFPMTNFNHIITCVPLQKDTMWLECTSQTVSPGFMGTFTGNRKAVAITDDGGVVVSTPKFIASENKTIRNVVATLNNNGDLTINSSGKLTGTEQEFEQSLLTEVTEQKRVEILNKYFDLPTYSIDKVVYKETRGKIPLLDETLVITAPAYASITGKRMFIQPNIFNKIHKLESDKPRLFDIVFKTAFTKIDSVEIKIPAGFTLEMMPKNVDINNNFGKYKITYNYNLDTIKCTRYFEQSTNKFPAKDYIDLVDFYDKVYKADNAKMVFTK